VLTRWRLCDVIGAAPAADPERAKFDARLLDKLRYCRDVLLSIKSASEGPAPAPALETRTSKMSLR
jgi:cell cycle serine/threonine-protein kinase CDC5/MSD2